MTPPRTTTTTALADELAGLDRLTTTELCARYAALYGQPTRTRHKAYLVRKVAWRLQARAEGGLTDRARARAAELADDADVRIMLPKAPAQREPPAPAAPARVVTVASPEAAADPRLPPPGTVLIRPYKGATVRVTVLADGFEHAGERYKTLAAVAQKVTGSHLSGYRFFRLTTGATR